MSLTATHRDSDAELARAAQNGDQASLALLLSRYRAPLKAQALGILGQGPAAEDAVHEAFVVALNRIQDVRDVSAVGGWLRTILRNQCLMQQRSGRHEVPAEDLRSIERSPVWPSAEEELDRLAMRDWVWREVERLSEPLRLVVLLRFFSSYRSYQQISEVCGVPVGTVRSRLNAAKRKLSEAMLDEAAGIDTEERRRAGMREEAMLAAMDDLNERHDLAAFTEPCVTDLTLGVGGAGEVFGLRRLVAGLEDDFAAGVKFHLTNVVASTGITVAEGRFENPPSNPTHCPPAAAQIHFHPDGRTERIVMHYASAPDASY